MWQPIETAPKDGTRILLRERWADHPFVGYWTGRYWTGETEHLKAEGGWDGAIIADNTTQADIFEWHPLPPVPIDQETAMKNADMPAMPGQVKSHGDGVIEILSVGGLTKREQACIALRVPETGDPEIDALIRTAVRRDVAAMAMQAIIQDTRIESSPAGVATEATWYADALLAGLEPKP